MEGLATYWQQADTVGRAVGLMLLLMSVSTWAVIFWKAWMLTRARRDLAVGTSAFWRAADLASARSALQTLDRDGVLLPLEPLDIPPQIPPEIREPHQPGEHLPLSTDPGLSPPTRH